ncbi:MAG: M48 family metallopeptidase, partial [Gammaproteobacteria bacterium]
IRQLDKPYSEYDWEIEVFDAEEVNAFAMPGGKIGVFTGIFKVATNQDELAAVIGHEVAHVTEDHALERANREAVTAGAVDFGAAAVGGSTGLGTQNSAVLLGMGAQLGLSLPYGRAQESEADLEGLVYMSNAGFDPRASIQLWKNMKGQKKGAPPEFLSTHPSSTSRIADLIAELREVLPLYNEALDADRRPDCQH